MPDLYFEQMCCELTMLCRVPYPIVVERLKALVARSPLDLESCYEAARAQLLMGWEDGWAARAILGKPDDHRAN